MASSAGGDTPDSTRVSVTGRHLELGEALTRQAEALMRQMATKYFGRAADATVIFTRGSKGSGFHCNIRFRVAHEIDFDGHGDHAKDARAALAIAAEHVDKQLRRMKRAKREDKPGNPDKDNAFRILGERVTDPDDALGIADGDGFGFDVESLARAANDPGYRDEGRPAHGQSVAAE